MRYVLFVFVVLFVACGGEDPDPAAWEAERRAREERRAATRAAAERAGTANPDRLTPDLRGGTGPAAAAVVGNCRGHVRGLMAPSDVEFPGGLFATGETEKVEILSSGIGQYDSFVHNGRQRRHFICESNETRVTDFLWLGPWFVP